MPLCIGSAVISLTRFAIQHYSAVLLAVHVCASACVSICVYVNRVNVCACVQVHVRVHTCVCSVYVCALCVCTYVHCVCETSCENTHPVKTLFVKTPFLYKDLAQ